MRILYPKNISRHDLGQNAAQPCNIIVILGPLHKRLGVFFVNLLGSLRYANMQQYYDVYVHIIIKLARRRRRRRRITDIILLSFGVCASYILFSRNSRARSWHTHTHTHKTARRARRRRRRRRRVHKPQWGPRRAGRPLSEARRDSPPPPRRHRDLGKKK